MGLSLYKPSTEADAAAVEAFFADKPTEVGRCKLDPELKELGFDP